MNQNDFKSMSTDELWALHEEVAKRQKFRRQVAIQIRCAAPLSCGRAKIPESGAAVRDLGRAWQDAPLADCPIEVGQADRRFPDQVRRVDRSAGPAGFGLLDELSQCLNLGEPPGQLCGRDRRLSWG